MLLPRPIRAPLPFVSSYPRTIASPAQSTSRDDLGTALANRAKTVLLTSILLHAAISFASPSDCEWSAYLKLLLLMVTLGAAWHCFIAQEWLSLTDPLTGALNRRSLGRVTRARRKRCNQKGAWISVLAIDIDFFKTVNDAHGHEAGDRVLRHTVRLLRQSVRKGDIVVRTGGDEFLVLLKGAVPDECKEIALRIQATSRHECATVCGATLSVGAVSAWCAGHPLPQLMAAADALLFEAKREGRNRVVFRTFLSTFHESDSIPPASAGDSAVTMAYGDIPPHAAPSAD